MTKRIALDFGEMESAILRWTYYRWCTHLIDTEFEAKALAKIILNDLAKYAT